MLSNYGSTILSSLGTIVPVLVLVAGLLLSIIIDLIKVNKKVTASIFILSIILSAFMLNNGDYMQKEAFSNMIKYTSLNVMGQYLILLASFLFGVMQLTCTNKSYNIEYFVLVYGIVIGSMVLVLIQNYLLFYLSLETISLSSYALTYFGEKTNKEAAIKYLIFGAVSSSVMLFGISLLYGFSGSLDIYTSLTMIGDESSSLVVVPVFFFLSGVLFKIGAFPFHFWLPDVYKSIKYDVIGLFSTVPKIAMFTFFFTWFDTFKWFEFSGYSLAEIIAMIAIITLAIANFTALSQKDMKGILAYSGISNTSYLLIPILVGGTAGQESFGFYLLSYTVVLFGLLYVLRAFDFSKLSDFYGLGRSNGFLGIVLTIFLVSLTGLPPTVGFGAKLLVFITLWKSSILEMSPILKTLFFFGIFNTVVGLFYYFKLPFVMFIKEGELKVISITLLNKVIIILLAISSVYLFFKLDFILTLLKSLH